MSTMRTAVALFTRDLRVHDNPMLRAALDEAEHVHPLFVDDDAIRETRYGAATARRAFLDECLADLDEALRRIGGALDVRRGDVVAETAAAARRVGAEDVFATADVSAYARERERRLARDSTCGSSTARSSSRPARWPRQDAITTRCSRRITARGAPIRAATISGRRDGCVSPEPPVSREGTRRREPRDSRAARPRGASGCSPGSEPTSARTRECTTTSRATRRPASPRTSTSGAFPARELANRAAELGAAAFVRQLCWRDFHGQLLAATPRTQLDDLRPRGDRWVDDADALAAWKDGLTGYPLVDAGCASSGRRAGCTTGRGSSPRRSSSRTSASTGEWARATTSTCSRRGCRPERRELAVGGRHRCRHASQPRVQPDRAGEAARPGRRVRPSLGAGAGRRPGRALPGAAGSRLSATDRRPRRGSGRLPRATRRVSGVSRASAPLADETTARPAGATCSGRSKRSAV